MIRELAARSGGAQIKILSDKQSEKGHKFVYFNNNQNYLSIVQIIIIISFHFINLKLKYCY